MPGIKTETGRFLWWSWHGKAFPKRLDCSFIQSKCHRTFRTAFLFVFLARNFRKKKLHKSRKSHNPAGPWHSGCTATHNSYFHKRLYHCTPLQSSACLFRLSVQIHLFLYLCSIRLTWNPASPITTLTLLQYYLPFGSLCVSRILEVSDIHIGNIYIMESQRRVSSRVQTSANGCHL